MNKPIEFSLPINKYLDQVDDCVKFTNNENTPYMAAQLVQKAHHAVLASGVYIDACKECRKRP